MSFEVARSGGGKGAISDVVCLHLWVKRYGNSTDAAGEGQRLPCLAGRGENKNLAKKAPSKTFRVTPGVTLKLFAWRLDLIIYSISSLLTSSSCSFPAFRPGRLQLLESQVSTPKRGSTQRLSTYQRTTTPTMARISMSYLLLIVFPIYIAETFGARGKRLPVS